MFTKCNNEYPVGDIIGIVLLSQGVLASFQCEHKVDIAYFVATEQLTFCKYPKICEPEATHGVNLGLRQLLPT